mgnify:CR=1 FL=1
MYLIKLLLISAACAYSTLISPSNSGKFIYIPVDTNEDSILATNLTTPSNSLLVGFSGLFDEVVLTSSNCELCF